MLLYLSIFLSVISILLMVVIIVRFKRLFSTEAIVEKVKSTMDRVIMDINNNANRDIDLINEKCREARALISSADKKIEEFHQATELLRNTIAEAENAVGKKRRVFYDDSSNAQSSGVSPSVNQILKNQASNTYKKKPEISPDATFEIKSKDEQNGQPSLFEEESILNDVTNVKQDGSAYKEVPLIAAKVYNDKKIEENKQDILKQKISKLFAQGMNAEDIALELSCSVSEVQFIIDMQ